MNRAFLLTLAVVAGLSLLTACNKKGPAAPAPTPTATPCVAMVIPGCGAIAVYLPVCGCDGKTYSNSAVAGCNSITNYTNGACP